MRRISFMAMSYSTLSLSACAILCCSALAESSGPFSLLAGHWSGGGNIKLSNGAQERVRCRATYNVYSTEKMQLNIRCAGDSYNFDLHGSAAYAGGKVNGAWSESTRNLGGRLSGVAKEDHIHVTVDSPEFAANLALTTHGDRQSVVIQSRNPDSNISGASLNLRR